MMEHLGVYKKLTMAGDKQSDAKLLKIHGEAQKLTQMINSWPKTGDFDRRPDDITKELMRSALDLQESLKTLSSLQESSKVMVSEMRYKNGELMTAGRFERLAMDGSLFHYIDELKKVIKESSSTGGQHPVNVPDNDGGDSWRRQSLGFLMSNDLTVQAKKAKSSSLIVKLMGLEEFPSGIDYAIRKEQKDDVCLTRPKSILAIEMKRTSGPLVKRQNPKPRTKTVDVVEIMKSQDSIVSDATKDLNKRMSCSGTRFSTETSRLPRSCGSKFDNVEMLSRRCSQKEINNAKRNKAMPYQNTANLGPVGQEHKRKVAISVREKDIAVSNLLANGGKPRDRKELKASAVSKSQPKVVSRAPAKSNNRRIIRNGNSPNQQAIAFKGANASRKHNPALTAKPRSQALDNIAEAKKITEVKPVRKSMDIRAVTGNPKSRDVKETIRNGNSPIDPTQKHMERDFTTYDREYTRKDSKLFCEVMVTGSKCSRGSSLVKQSSPHPNDETKVGTLAEEEEVDVQLLLLSSNSFVSRAQELFRLSGYQTTVHRGISKPRTTNVDLILDCANELMSRKRRQLEISKHQMLQSNSRSMAVVVSLHQLVAEISSGVNKMRGYNKDAANAASIKDGVYVRLERDLECRDMMLNAMWDVGWVNCICVEEADIVVGQVEELILYALLEELAMELKL